MADSLFFPHTVPFMAHMPPRAPRPVDAVQVTVKVLSLKTDTSRQAVKRFCIFNCIRVFFTDWRGTSTPSSFHRRMDFEGEWQQTVLLLGVLPL
ncbi:hypothetical protein PHLCEN_2v705 [Hermanssonia centrifuga]|uniref:Uncharacterized protein n=1 Tax=Hermanssonia centrifuga TaxID=98765 RepID=A0A2R6S5D7_9APHY|nr:hypothetical protein PHLCEN_2v705 [Hermanssonia centrifuga]